MNTKNHQARAFALAVAAIRSDAEMLEDAPLYCDMEDRKTYRYIDHLPRREYRLPTPGNPRGMIVSAPAARDSLNALADRLEKGARAFGGQPPRRDRSPLNTRGIVAARNAHAEGHRNAAHRALGDRLFIAASGHPFAVVSQMQAAGHDVLLCRSIAARSNKIIAFCARSGVRLAAAGNASAPADFNDFCAWLDSRVADCSGKLESMASLGQAAAVADYLDGDTVEAIDPEAEPCDTAAAVARAEASAAPEPEPEPMPEPEPEPSRAPEPVPDPEPVPVPVPVPMPGDAARPTRPAKAGDTAGEKLASPQAVKPRGLNLNLSNFGAMTMNYHLSIKRPLSMESDRETLEARLKFGGLSTRRMHYVLVGGRPRVLVIPARGYPRLWAPVSPIIWQSHRVEGDNLVYEGALTRPSGIAELESAIVGRLPVAKFD